MARLQTFLPELESANRQLEQVVSVDPKKVDIENVDDSEQYIEMVSAFARRGYCLDLLSNPFLCSEFGIGSI